MNPLQQELYWRQFSHYYTDLIPRAVYEQALLASDSVADGGFCYNVALMRKGLLLHSQRLLQQALHGESYIQLLTATWQQLAGHLKSTEVAVEFVNFNVPHSRYSYYYVPTDTLIYKIPAGDMNASMYGAVVLTPTLANPVFVPLFDAAAFDTITVNEPWQRELLSHLIWEPLAPYLQDAKTVYFSPDGILHQLPIESLPCPWGEGMLADYLQLYRLSSTRELLPHSSSGVGNAAAIFGGLTYDVTDNSSNPTAYGTSRGAVSDLYELQGTLIEAEDIAAMLAMLKPDIRVKTFLSDQRTETSFRSLGNKNLRLLHLATHGFYYDQSNPRLHELTLKLDLGIDAMSMRCSGLYLAGANGALNETSYFEVEDDGVLTAEEIAQMNLQTLDLVTLSACQTGLGLVTGEGVFGLQRGFKKAGANSILMSLWKVDDEATCLLMTEFYKHWIAEGRTKHDALELAKQTVRSHKERGWDDPKYWAAFILLDGLD